ncbi:MAG TPA: maleylpyruvate isomerase family mycothiol-dependent enzyme [Frankiaceae bacterium]|jgi:uncharacterized protein (TIGR03083 family)|nr:maleylpyruvate isomerase family mycothiol-dependent enzyme [Frankiaceae bacterium]
MTDVFDLVATERRRAADLFESLDDAQLATRTLCSAWTARDMAGHLVVPFSYSPPRLVLGLAKARGSFHRFNARAAVEQGRRPLADLVETLRRKATSRWTPPGHPPSAPLTDVCVHTRDVARPLGLDTGAPPETWRFVLDFLVTPVAHRAFVPKGRIEGLRLRATDLDWSHGDGAEVSGPSEALALALVGRGVALDDLSGDGVAVLRGRLG